MKYLVPVDGSPNANVAFNTALKMLNKENDILLILNVIEDLLVFSGFPDAPVSVYSAAQEYAKTESKKTLLKYARVCLDEGINYKSLSTISNHVGDSICHIVDEYNVDFLIIGRRGMSKFKRFFIGSTSRYCVENANTNVIVVKEGPLEEFLQPTVRKHEVISSTEHPHPHELTSSTGHPTEKSELKKELTTTSSSVIPPAPPNPLDKPIETEKKPSHPSEKHSIKHSSSAPALVGCLSEPGCHVGKEKNVSFSAPALRHTEKEGLEKESLEKRPSSTPPELPSQIEKSSLGLESEKQKPFLIQPTPIDIKAFTTTREVIEKREERQLKETITHDPKKEQKSTKVEVSPKSTVN